jgi:hypothetical protein
VLLMMMVPPTSNAAVAADRILMMMVLLVRLMMLVHRLGLWLLLRNVVSAMRRRRHWRWSTSGTTTATILVMGQWIHNIDRIDRRLRASPVTAGVALAAAATTASPSVLGVDFSNEGMIVVQFLLGCHLSLPLPALALPQAGRDPFPQKPFAVRQHTRLHGESRCFFSFSTLFFCNHCDCFYLNG